MKKQIKWFMFILLSFLLIGCTFYEVSKKVVMNWEAKQEKEKQMKWQVILSERQKKVLRKLGLPEDYDKLTDSQKDGIYQIGKSLEHLEAKYDREFEYLNYIYGGPDGKHVKATANDTYPVKVATVRITATDIDSGDELFSYADDFEAKLAEEIYPKEAKKFLVKYLEEDDFKVYSKLSELLPEGNSIVAKAVGGVFIFVRNTYSEAEIEETVKEYVKWVSSLKGEPRGAAIMIVMNDEKFSEVNSENYREYTAEDIYRVKASFDVKGNLVTTWYRKDENGNPID